MFCEMTQYTIHNWLHQNFFAVIISSWWVLRCLSTQLVSKILTNIEKRSSSAYLLWKYYFISCDNIQVIVSNAYFQRLQGTGQLEIYFAIYLFCGCQLQAAVGILLFLWCNRGASSRCWRGWRKPFLFSQVTDMLCWKVLLPTNWKYVQEKVG